ncbi:MAG: 6,7-dimethyl-8-ribityllumazine synthase [Methanobacteriota archaeon]|nr:MAG: 6,7-dimethyl-8-ribityllumazine synthase [Euryarchaeota archaeon]
MRSRVGARDGRTPARGQGLRPRGGLRPPSGAGPDRQAHPRRHGARRRGRGRGRARRAVRPTDSRARGERVRSSLPAGRDPGAGGDGSAGGIRRRRATPGDADVRLVIVAAEFNREVADLMVKRALARAEERDIRVTSVVRVPGVFEIPLAVQRLLERADVDAAVAIGAVIKGETLHDEALMAAVPKALLDIERATHKPIGLGITGPGMTDEQAMARVDKGAEAVDVALAMHELLRGI